jgi:hypothetical protein
MMERLGEMIRLVCSSSRVNGRRPSQPDGIFLIFRPECSTRNFGPKFQPETSASGLGQSRMRVELDSYDGLPVRPCQPISTDWKSVVPKK